MVEHNAIAGTDGSPGIATELLMIVAEVSPAKGQMAKTMPNIKTNAAARKSIARRL